MTTTQKETPSMAGNHDGASGAEEETARHLQVTPGDSHAPGELAQSVVNVAGSVPAAIGKITRGLPPQDHNGPNLPSVLIEHGFSLVPIPHGTKGPKIPKWQSTTFGAADFRSPCNWGFQLGKSGLIDIDLDCPEALEIARQALPGTATYGRQGNPQSHWLYLAGDAQATQTKSVKYTMPRRVSEQDKDGTTLIELRSGKSQSVAPGSVHVSGERIRWETDLGSLASAPADLHERVRAIALDCFLQRAGIPKTGDVRAVAIAADYVAADVDKLIGGGADAVSTGVSAAVTAPTTTPTTSLKGLTELSAEERETVIAAITSEYPELGSRHDYRWRWRCVMARWGVGTALALELINTASERAGAGERARLAEYETDLAELAADVPKYGIPALKELVSDETFRVIEAILDTKKRRVARVAMSTQRLVEQLDKGAADRPKNESNVLVTNGGDVPILNASFENLASTFLDLNYPRGDLRIWRGDWYRWDGTHYEELEREMLEDQVGRFIASVKILGDNKPPKPMQSSPNNIRAVYRNLTCVRGKEQVRMNRKQEPDPKFRALANGVLDVRTGELLPHDPERLVFSAAAWSWAPETPTPEWDAFLASLDFDDTNMRCLQDAMGYLVYGDTEHDKMVTFIGAPRSGKGTIAGVVSKLVGRAASISLSDYGRDFKLASAIGADVLIDYDQRSTGQQQGDQEAIAQRLLMISANEPVTIDRKYGQVWEGALGKVLVCSNKVPAIKDSGGALARRWVIVNFHRSFLGQEDHKLSERLEAELAGIAAWALEGWRRVHKRGGFVESEKAQETRELMKSAGSLAEAYVSEKCETGPDRSTPRQALYDDFAQWCQQQGERNVPTMRSFGTELQAANIPGFQWTHRPRISGSLVYVVKGIALAR